MDYVEILFRENFHISHLTDGHLKVWSVDIYQLLLSSRDLFAPQDATVQSRLCEGV